MSECRTIHWSRSLSHVVRAWHGWCISSFPFSGPWIPIYILPGAPLWSFLIKCSCSLYFTPIEEALYYINVLLHHSYEPGLHYSTASVVVQSGELRIISRQELLHLFYYIFIHNSSDNKRTIYIKHLATFLELAHKMEQSAILPGGTEVFLKFEKDWPRWIEALEFAARARSSWDIVNPDGKEFKNPSESNLERPKSIEEFMLDQDTVNHNVFLAQSRAFNDNNSSPSASSGTAPVAPSKVTFLEVKDFYNARVAEYKLDLAEQALWSARYDVINSWIVKRVDPKLLEICISELCHNKSFSLQKLVICLRKHRSPTLESELHQLVSV